MKKKRLLINAFLIATLIIFPLLHATVHASEDDIVSINLFNKKHYGTLSKQGKESVFSSLSDMEPPLTITGTWKDGSFDGDCTISYEDGTIQSVTYSNQKISGEVLTEYPDGRHDIYSCATGKRVGMIQYYNSDGEFAGVDWFHNSVPIHTLVENAMDADYADIIASPSEYIDTPIKVSGTITEVFDSNNQCYLILTDLRNNNYLFYYRNAEITSNYASISIMENLSVGESVTIYGIFENIGELSNTKKIFNSQYGYQSDFSTLRSHLFDMNKLSDMRNLFPNDHPILNTSMPLLNAVFCETENTFEDPLQIPETYENICRCPLYFMGQNVEQDGTVLYDSFQNKKRRIFRLIECAPGEYYIITEKSSSFSSMVGESISIQGVLSGNRKLPYFYSQEIGYAIYPSIEVSQ